MNEEQKVQKELKPVKNEQEVKKKRVTVTQEMRLNEYRGVVENTFADPVIRDKAAAYGYDKKRLLEGKALLAEAVGLYEKFKNKQADQILKYKEFAGNWHMARETYHRFLRILRLAYPGNKELLDRIGVKFITENPFGVGAARAKLFYNNIEQMPEVLAEVGKYNVTLQELQEGKQQVLNAELADSQHSNAMAETQQASEAKSREYKKLRTWITDYRKVMRVALKSDGQLLEKLGVRVPTPPASR